MIVPDFLAVLSVCVQNAIEVYSQNKLVKITR